MNLNLNETWRELYGAGRVRWMAGMLTTTGHRLSDMDDGYFALTMRSHGGGYATKNLTSYTPDFNDPATVGCLLYQASELYGGPFYIRRYHSEIYRKDIYQPINVDDTLRSNTADSEPAAILAAIQAAPLKVTE